MAIGGELDSGEEAALLDAGSSQDDPLGISLYPSEHGRTGWLEFDSMINVRPRQGNRSRYVEDASIRSHIAGMVGRLVRP